MQRRFLQGFIISIIFLFISIYINTQYIYARTLKEEAESYRAQGYEAQERGNIDIAITFYNKSCELDHKYAAPHNDLGILYEAKGWLDRAENEYQEALVIDPQYEKAHTNLALLYERKGELEKAAYHWMRRYKLGRSGDPWTNEAKERLEKLGLLDQKDIRPESLPAREASKKESIKEEEAEKKTDWKRIGAKTKAEPEYKGEEKKKITKKSKKHKTAIAKAGTEKNVKAKTSEWTRIDFGSCDKTAGTTAKTKVSKAGKSDLDKELQESLRLAEERLKEERQEKKKEVSRTAAATKEIPVRSTSDPGAREYQQRAQKYYDNGEYSKALDEIRIAKKDYPVDSSLLELELSIKNKMKEERIEDHYSEGIMRYRQKDFSGAKKEFEAILNILPE